MLRLTALAFTLALLPLTGCQDEHHTHGGHVHDADHAEHAHSHAPYRHVVAFRFKETTTQAEIDAINAAFAKLPSQIDTIRHFEYGKNVSPEGLNDGFTYCYLVTFDDRAGLDVYLPHPAHKAFVAMLKGKLDKPFVIDYVPAMMK